MSFKVQICLLLFSIVFAHATHRPEEQRLKDCSKSCYDQHHGGDERLEAACQKRCLDEFKEACGGENPNPYVFGDKHFMTGMQTQHGRLRILQRFTEQSDLLEGIQNYRVAILEADPQTFVLPQHWDADAVVVVTEGRGTVSFARQDTRESFNVKQGDLLRIRAGTTTYMINNESGLVLTQLIHPVNTPGRFQAFFGAGGENPESFFRVFTDDILEAAFNTNKEKLHRVFGQQKQGAIVKASQKQIKAMISQQEEGGGVWPFGGESKGTVNLYQQRPTQSNQYGQLYEVDSRQYKQLEDLDIEVSLANITQGAMAAPHYNSRGTKIGIVVEGEGYLEMACPHISQSRERQQGGSSQRETIPGPTYQKISAPLKRGTVVVVPAGHPTVAVASDNQGLQLLFFTVNHRDNERFPLAGKRNVMKQLEREAKELAFGVPAEEVEEVFNSQDEEFFFKGPRQQQQKGRAEA